MLLPFQAIIMLRLILGYPWINYAGSVHNLK